MYLLAYLLYRFPSYLPIYLPTLQLCNQVGLSISRTKLSLYYSFKVGRLAGIDKTSLHLLAFSRFKKLKLLVGIKYLHYLLKLSK